MSSPGNQHYKPQTPAPYFKYKISQYSRRVIAVLLWENTSSKGSLGSTFRKYESIFMSTINRRDTVDSFVNQQLEVEASWLHTGRF